MMKSDTHLSASATRKASELHESVNPLLGHARRRRGAKAVSKHIFTLR